MQCKKWKSLALVAVTCAALAAHAGPTTLTFSNSQLGFLICSFKSFKLSAPLRLMHVAVHYAATYNRLPVMRKPGVRHNAMLYFPVVPL